jgi:hypothetical protein
MQDIFETKKIELPQSLIDKGYEGPASVKVYEKSWGKYQMIPQIGLAGIQKMTPEIVGKLITLLPEFEGNDVTAILESEKILEDVENWPNY